MKVKKLTISINIPSEYRWVARQPYGDITLFKRKPKIVTGDRWNPDIQYWGVQKDNINVLEGDLQGCLGLNMYDDWKDSLEKI